MRYLIILTTIILISGCNPQYTAQPVQQPVQQVSPQFRADYVQCHQFAVMMANQAAGPMTGPSFGNPMSAGALSGLTKSLVYDKHLKECMAMKGWM